MYMFDKDGLLTHVNLLVSVIATVVKDFALFILVILSYWFIQVHITDICSSIQLLYSSMCKNKYSKKVRFLSQFRTTNALVMHILSYYYLLWS